VLFFTDFVKKSSPLDEEDLCNLDLHLSGRIPVGIGTFLHEAMVAVAS